MAIDSAKPLPYPTIVPYLCVDDSTAAVAFYTKVFGAEERMMLRLDDGTLAHGELAIGDGAIMLSDPFPDSQATPPPRGAESYPMHLSIYVDNADDTYALALAQGATSLREPSDQFYGDRTASFEDPFGHRWNVQHNIEPLSPDAIIARMSAM